MSSFNGKNTTGGSASNVLRQVGSAEGYQSALHLLRLYHACVVTSQYKLRDPSPAVHVELDLEAVFEQALALTILEHSLLQVGLANEDSKRPSWIRIQSIDFGNLVKWKNIGDSESHEETLLEILREQHDTPFQFLEKQPPWRIVALKTASLSSVDVVFAWSHAVADGMSGKIFHQSFLKNLNYAYSRESLVEGLTDRVLKLPPLLRLTPPLEELLRFPISVGYLASEGWQAIRPSFLGSKTQYAATWAPIKISPNQTCLRLVRIGGPDLKSILQRCRQEGTTLTGLLHALALLSFATRLDPTQARAFEAATPFDFRRFISKDPPGHAGLDPHQTIGNLVGVFDHKVDAETVEGLRHKSKQAATDASTVSVLERNVWAKAKDFRDQITQRLEAGTRNTSFGLTKFIGDWRKFHKDESKKPRVHSWETSNLGVLEGQVSEDVSKEGNAWSVENAIFSQSAGVNVAALLISPISVKGKSLTICCSWQKEAIQEELAVGAATDVHTWLINIARDESLSVKKE